MKELFNNLIATNDKILYDDPTDSVSPVPAIHSNRIEDWYIARRITSVFGYFDQRGRLVSRVQPKKQQGKSTRVVIDDDLDKKFRALLGL